MKKLLLALLSLTIVFCSLALVACGENNATPADKPLDPPVEIVNTDDFVFTYNKSTKTYTVAPTETAQQKESLTIPGSINGYRVTTLKDNSFAQNQNLKSVVLESGFTSIGMNAFLKCSALTSVTLPDTMLVIKKKAFADCSSLTTINLTSQIRTIEEQAFSGCTSLKEITLPDALKVISVKLFSGAGLTKIAMHENIMRIDEGAFSGCASLVDVKLNKKLEKIGNDAFMKCTSLTEILFPRNDTLVLGDYAFAEAGLTKVYIPSNVVLGTYTFQKLAWDTTIPNPGDSSNPGASRCTAIYYESPNGSRGINTFGYTWNRPDLGFRIYVPAGSLGYYNTNNPGDEAWARCVVSSVNSVNGTFRVLEEYDINEVFPNGFPVAE